MNFGENLKILRKNSKISQEESTKYGSRVIILKDGKIENE